MSQFSRSPVTAVLGPTNTGKTHLAVERLCAHSSGMMGFPLRLLAREVYDRVVAIKGPKEVALITGEEKIMPEGARWFLCTAESMPLEKEFAFVALDEAQLGIDPERGHIFTDRMLRARGRKETMILGSAALTPMVKALLPKAEIISRPRFSTLSYAGAKKLSRLPKRSAIVAFSAEEVYAVAEMLRRLRGGAAVVMGALSPSTRNAQVEMFMNGDVDYLVATDAIGMGLNLDVTHVAFASLRKFDGRRTRRLTVMEMAQIAGRAGRHHKDGTFGSLGGEDGEGGFTPEEIDAIENHRFSPIESLYWRDGQPSMSSIDGLIDALEARPTVPQLRPAPQSADLAVLKTMAGDPLVRQRVRNPAAVRRLWDCCGLPDFQKLGADHHARMVSRLWQFRSEGNGYVPRDWFAQNISRLDTVQGDMDTLSGRIAAVRTWSYIAHRPDWLEKPAEMAQRTREIEEKLSDALHSALTQRFVDRRTSLLLRDIGRNRDDLPFDLDEDGTVHVDGEPLGRLHGFRFLVDPQARGGDRKLLLAAAERRLGKMLTVKAEELIAAPDSELTLNAAPGANPQILWREDPVATLHSGASLLSPEIRVDKAITALGQDIANSVVTRIQGWMKAQHERHLAPLLRILEQAGLPETPAVVRALFIQLADAGGIMARTDLDDALALLDKEQRQIVRKAGFTIGVLDIYHHALLKPGASLWRLALSAVKRDKPMLPLPQAGAVLLTLSEREAQMGARHAGYRGFGDAQVRIDMVERIARGGHEAIAKNERYDVLSPFIVSLGLSEQLFNTIMRNAGFRQITPRAEEAAVAQEQEAEVAPVDGVQAEAVVAEEGAANVAEDSVAPAEVQPADADTSVEEAAAQADAVEENAAQIEPTQVEVADSPSTDVTPDDASGEAADNAPALASETASEAVPADAEATPASADAEESAAVPPQGANWVFRGRRKPREPYAGGRRDGADRNRGGHSGAGYNARQDDRGQDGPRNARGGKGGQRDGRDNRENRDNRSGKGPRKGDGGRRDQPATYRSREPERPAGGGAFAELATLLGRKD
ncbi:MAG: helicase [Sphingobium sp.]|nr:helicase [Sphingobium sp.]